MKQVLNLKSGAVTLVTASNEPDTMISNILKGLPDWDGIPYIDVKTVQKLIGPGSYETSTEISHRDVKIELHVTGDWKALRRRFESTALSFTPVTIELIQYTTDTTSIKETLIGKIVSVTPGLARDQFADITLIIRCLNPIKTIT